MISVVLLVTVLVAVNGQVPVPVRDYRLNPYYNEAPKPYAFSYNAPLDDGVGQSSRSESGDAAGRVTGSYSLNNDEGHYRVVDYVADENGFRASVRTNEPGTDNQSPADVVMQSEAGPVVPYTPYARRPLLNAPVVVPEAPVELTENALPIVPRRPVYNRPGAYIPRNYNRNVYNRPRYAYNG